MATRKWARLDVRSNKLRTALYDNEADAESAMGKNEKVVVVMIRSERKRSPSVDPAVVKASMDKTEDLLARLRDRTRQLREAAG